MVDELPVTVTLPLEMTRVLESPHREIEIERAIRTVAAVTPRWPRRPRETIIQQRPNKVFANTAPPYLARGRITLEAAERRAVKLANFVFQRKRWCYSGSPFRARAMHGAG